MSDHIDRAADLLREHLSIAKETGEPDEVDCCAEALDAAGLLRRPTDPEVHVDITGTGRTCVVKVSGQTIFDGVGREALIRTKSAAEHDAAVAAKALQDAAADLGRRASDPALIESADRFSGYYTGVRSAMQREIQLLHERADAIERNATT